MRKKEARAVADGMVTGLTFLGVWWERFRPGWWNVHYSMPDGRTVVVVVEDATGRAEFYPVM